MKSASRITARLFALVCVVGFVVTLPVATLLFNAERRVFDANTYKIALAEQNIYGQLPTLLSEQLIRSSQGDPKMFLLKALKPHDIEAVVRVVLPPADLQRLTEQALDQIFAYLNGEITTPQLSMQVLKDRLHTDGVNAILQVLHAQPPCSDAQTAALAAGALSGAGSTLTCSPPDSLAGLITPLLQALIDDQIKAIPDNLPLAGVTARNPADGIRLLRLLMRLSPLVPIGFLFIVTLLVVRTLRDWLRWWGIPLALGAGLTLIGGLGLAPLLILFFNRTVLPRIPSSISAGIVQAITQLLTSIAGMLARPIVIEAAVLGLVGLFLFFVSRFAGVDESSQG